MMMIIIKIIIIIIISLLTYTKHIVICKLKVEKRTIKTYLQFISISRLIFKHNFFKEKTNVIIIIKIIKTTSLSTYSKTIYKLKVPIPKYPI